MTTIPLETEPGAPVIVVQTIDLENATLKGWRLIAVLPTEGTETIYTTIPNPNKKEDYDQDTIGVNEPHAFKRTEFLLTKTAETALAEATKENTELSVRCCELSAQVERQSGLIQKDGDRIVELVKTCDKRSEAIDVELNRRRKLQDRLNAMEKDIAKLRVHFGEKALAEALRSE